MGLTLFTTCTRDKFSEGDKIFIAEPFQRTLKVSSSLLHMCHICMFKFVQQSKSIFAWDLHCYRKSILLTCLNNSTFMLCISIDHLPDVPR